MTEHSPPGQPSAPEVVQKSHSLPTVWIVPLVAVLIGGWLAFKHFRDAGVPIQVTFATASGIEAGKTKVKFKDIQVGLVDTVSFTDDLSGVVLGITMKRESKPHLKEQCEFWVVQPRVGPGGISGLGTIVSGAYLNMRIGGGEPARKFVGREMPPVASPDVKGLRFTLTAEELGSIGPGESIFFRNVKVGEVEETRLNDDGSGVQIKAIVKAPYDRFVRTSSHFWNASGVEVSLDADGLSVRSEGLTGLLAGGVAFDSPAEGGPVQDGAVFPLFPGFKEASHRPPVEKGPFFVIYPPGETRGLEIGASVTLEGVVIGEVTDVKMEYSPEFGIRTPVRIRLEPSSVQGVQEDDDEAITAMINDLVGRGLRAQLKSESLLTGALYVDLGFHPDVPVELVGGGDLPELPTAPTTLDNLENKAGLFLDHLSNMPLEGLLTDAQETVSSLRVLIDKVEGRVDPLADGVDGLTAQAQQTLAAATDAIKVIQTIGTGIAPGSPMYHDLATALEELSAAARSIRVLSGYLERNPSALIMGKSKSGGQP